MKLKELKKSLKNIGTVVSKSKTETVNDKPAYNIKGESGLYTKEYLIFLCSGNS